MSSAEMEKVMTTNSSVIFTGFSGIASEGGRYYDFCRNIDRIGSGELDIRDIAGMFLAEK